MSSDGSVSSGISQFGLYRTIDARTEEFLKLSKKKQIKQGCVCAAISTALTVTIVVIFLLIYEYNVIAEARRSSHKNNWLGLMNNSADDPDLLEILNKEKIDIDKTTLKLLPILLKALKQNRYLEKIIEEPTSLITPSEKEITTETAITKNIFADPRNWMKTPHSRLYTIEYKTSPILYFKSPTRNVDYFTKIRKIRDYQRILNYVDKMISEKTSLGTTQPMKRENSYTEKPLKMTTPIRKYKLTRKAVGQQKTTQKMSNTTEEKKMNCKCSNKLSEVMNKLLVNIQQLLSYFSGSNLKEPARCSKDSPIQTKPLKFLSKLPSNKNVHNIKTENHKVFETKLTRTPPYKTFLNKHKYIIEHQKNNFDIRRDQTVNAIMNLIKPSFNKYDDVDINFESSEAFSTTNSYMKFSEQNNKFKDSNSESYTNSLDNIETKVSPDAVTTVADYILQKGTYDVSSDQIRSSLSTFPETDFGDDDDYTETTETTTILANHLNNRLDTYSLEFMKNNLIPPRKNITNNDKFNPFKGAKMSQKLFNNFASMRKVGNLVSDATENSRYLPKQRNIPALKKKNLKTITTLSKLEPTYRINATSTNKLIDKIETIRNQTKAKNIEPKDSSQNQTYNITSKVKAEIVWDENGSKETTLKQIEEAIMILNNETTKKQVENYDKVSTETYQWDLVTVEENGTSTKSMIPLGRSTYLEMQRNDWKHDENHDFDSDMNYIFD